MFVNKFCEFFLFLFIEIDKVLVEVKFFCMGKIVCFNRENVCFVNIDVVMLYLVYWLCMLFWNVIWL